MISEILLRDISNNSIKDFITIENAYENQSLTYEPLHYDKSEGNLYLTEVSIENSA